MNLFETYDADLMRRSIRWTIKTDRGEEERGSGIGVYRDVLSSFWNEFYSGYCLGDEELVPQIRHDVTRQDWISIVNVFIKGYSDCGYVPARINKIFLKLCLYGNEASISDEELLSCFFMFMSKEDSKTIKSAINGEEEDDDNLLDILTSLGSKRVCYSGEPLKGLMVELAHKEFIQTPAFIKELWEQQFNIHNFSKM